MDPLTFLVLIIFSLILALGLLLFAPDLLLVHGPLLSLCWIAGMGLYIGCAYLSAWFEDVLAAREQAELDRWRADLDRSRRG